MRAFWDLNSERPLGGSMIGPIPRSKAIAYAIDLLGEGAYMVEPFWRIIHEIDVGYLEWNKQEHRRAVESQRQMEAARAAAAAAKRERR